ncbi:hypothetical protein RF11_05462 [Thelohanellus kitauei]|uniref:Tc1-like transposase DDE domain-containing protein n=1 Tax=Thelohanellus kitauei TaxID=669202 RepID=A0A0C2JG89_THEKT|nr:hypothetical protein RF11_05462 [Thelohanellus kitauei]
MRQSYYRMVFNISDDRILFIDETGINLHINPHYGYSPAGLTATISEPANKGVNISVLVAIALTGVVHYMIVDEAIDGELFRDFMTQLWRMNSNLSNVYVMDNARIHKSRVVSAYIQESNMRAEFLPPYSPQLNPIEEYFSHFENLIRHRRSQSTTRQKLKEIATAILTNDKEFSMAGFLGI